VTVYVCGLLCALITLSAETTPRNISALPITAIAFAPGGKEFVAASQSGLTVYAWPSLEKQREFIAKFSHINDLAFSADGKALAIAGGQPGEAGGFQLFDWPSGSARNRVHLLPDVAYQLTWLARGPQLVLAGANGALLRVTTDGDVIRRYAGHSRDVTCVVVTGDGEHLCSGSSDQSLRVWNLETGELLRTLNNHTNEVLDLTLRPGKEGVPFVASAGGDKMVRFWQPTIGRMVRFVRLTSTPLGIDWTCDGRFVLAACDDGGLQVIDAAAAKVVQKAPGRGGWANAVAATSNQGALVGGEDGMIRFISLISD
jgi:WD40 repeat protein